MHIIRTIIADDHRIVIEGLKAVLSKERTERYQLVGAFYDGKSLINALKMLEADLLILDLNLPEKDGLEVIKYIRKEALDIKILALTMYDDPKIVKMAFKFGVDGYILKNKGLEELFQATEALQKDETFVGNGVALSNGIFEKPEQKKGTVAFEDRFIRKHSLTKRELEILHLITQALSNKQIAKELFISDQTVSVHRKNIMRKLGVSNTAGLIKVAYDNSLVQEKQIFIITFDQFKEHSENIQSQVLMNRYRKN